MAGGSLVVGVVALDVGVTDAVVSVDASVDVPVAVVCKSFKSHLHNTRKWKPTAKSKTAGQNGAGQSRTKWRAMQGRAAKSNTGQGGAGQGGAGQGRAG